MKTQKLLLTLFALVIISWPSFSWARSGCCSHHGGVCGCECCDGSSLSATCAPYYPSCNSDPVEEVYVQPEPDSTPTSAPIPDTKKETTTPVSSSVTSDPITEKDKLISDKNVQIRNLQDERSDKDKIISDKNTQISNLQDERSDAESWASWMTVTSIALGVWLRSTHLKKKRLEQELSKLKSSNHNEQ